MITLHYRSPTTSTSDKPRDNRLVNNYFTSPLARGTDRPPRQRPASSLRNLLRAHTYEYVARGFKFKNSICNRQKTTHCNTTRFFALTVTIIKMLMWLFSQLLRMHCHVPTCRTCSLKPKKSEVSELTRIINHGKLCYYYNKLSSDKSWKLTKEKSNSMSSKLR